MSGGGHRSLGRAGFDHLVYLRVFEGCNLHCEHCFIPSNPKRMDLDAIARVPEIARGFAGPGSTILVQWHGGEPTMFGAEWMARAIETLEREGPDMIWTHGIQTNLMTYDAAWRDLYRARFDGEVGVSWDPAIRLLRRGRPESHAEYDARFWANLDRAVGDGLSPYLVTTFTKTFLEAFPNPMDYFDKLVAHGVERAHLERVTRTGYAREQWDRIGLNNAEYSVGMQRFLRSYLLWRKGRTDGLPSLSLSPFDGLVGSVRTLGEGRGKGYGCWSGACDTRFHTIDAAGYKRGCTAITSEIDNKRAAAALFFPDPTAERVARRFHCGNCPFRPICSSGCLALNVDDGSGECSGAQGLFAAAQRLAAAADFSDEAGPA